MGGGGAQKTKLSFIFQKNMVLLPGEASHSYFRIHFNRLQQGGRLPIPECMGFQRMETADYTIFHRAYLILWKPQIGLFASRLSHQLPRYVS